MVWQTGSRSQAICRSISAALNVSASSRRILAPRQRSRRLRHPTPVCRWLSVVWHTLAPAETLLVFLTFFFFWRVLQGKMHGPSYTRLHAPWPVLSREAEFLKIKVPTKTVRCAPLQHTARKCAARGAKCHLFARCVVFRQSYKLKKESSFGSRMSTLWRKVNQPFQPKVPQQDQGSTKFLSHYFSREKLHM